jgi:hypothetical protein
LSGEDRPQTHFVCMSYRSENGRDLIIQPGEALLPERLPRCSEFEQREDRCLPAEMKVERLLTDL